MKILNIKFHGNPSNASRAVHADGETAGRTVRSSLALYATKKQDKMSEAFVAFVVASCCMWTAEFGTSVHSRRDSESFLSFSGSDVREVKKRANK